MKCPNCSRRISLLSGSEYFCKGCNKKLVAKKLWLAWLPVLPMIWFINPFLLESSDRTLIKLAIILTVASSLYCLLKAMLVKYEVSNI